MNRELRRKMVLTLAVCLLCGLLSGYAAVDTPQDKQEFSYGKLPVYVDEVLEYTGYLAQGKVYVPLRSFCGALNMGAVVSWDESTDTMCVSLTHEGTAHTLTARVGDIYLYVNDRIVYLGAEILSRRGNVLVPLDGLCGAFGISAVCEAAGVKLSTESLQLCSRGSEVYDSEDLKWLSHIINAEAGNQSLEGQICVGNVVLNRVAHENFPDTVQAVIFSPNQFCPVKSGTIYCTPDADAVAAAKLCLEGVNLAGESIYFVNPRTGSTAWFREHLTYAMTVGEHDFYY